MHSKQSPARVTAAARRAEALRLRAAGKTYAEIACALCINESSAWRLVQREFDRLNADTRETAEQIRQVECARLDALHAALWPTAKTGNTQAIFAVLKVMDRRAKLLGLDSPAKVDFGDSGRTGIAAMIALAQNPEKYAACDEPLLPPEAYQWPGESREGSENPSTEGES